MIDLTKNNQNFLTRRCVVQLVAAAIGNGLLGVCGSGAAEKIPFGAAVLLEAFRNDPEMKEMLIRHVDVIVPMNALKWGLLRHTEGQFDFSGSDELIEFARQYGKTVHGHTLLWYHANPRWLDAITSPSQLEKLLREHIQTVVGRYAGRVATWDVVNEVVAHDPISQGKWRRGVWYDGLGPRHVDLAFEEAARTDPKARLFINDYDLEDSSRRTKTRQDAILSIVRRLQDKNIPIHGVGLQAHLYAEREIGGENLAAFVTELTRLGLEISVTELDVIDWKLAADIEKRDRGVASTANEFLNALTKAVTPRMITTWGLCDKYSWIGDVFPRSDDARARPLPFDENWQPKSMFDQIKHYTNG